MSNGIFPSLASFNFLSLLQHRIGRDTKAVQLNSFVSASLILLPFHIREWKSFIWPTITLLLAPNQPIFFDASAVHTIISTPSPFSALSSLWTAQKRRATCPHVKVLSHRTIMDHSSFSLPISWWSPCVSVLTRLVAKLMAARTFKIDDYFIIIATVRSYPRVYPVYCF